MHVGKGPGHLPDVFKDDMMSLNRCWERQSSEQQGDERNGRPGREEVVTANGFPEFVG